MKLICYKNTVLTEFGKTATFSVLLGTNYINSIFQIWWVHEVAYSDSKIVQLDLLGVAVVFFSFVSYLQICFSLYIFIDQLASMLIGFLAWLEHFVRVWSHQDPSVSPHEVTG